MLSSSSICTGTSGFTFTLSCTINQLSTGNKLAFNVTNIMNAGT